MINSLRNAQRWLNAAFDEPRTKPQIVVTILSMSAVIASIIQIAFVSEHPAAVLAHPMALGGVEWALTVFFTVEIALRIFAKPRPRDYILSRYGIIDILAVAPTWLSLAFTGLPSLNWLRALRLVRLLRIVDTLRAIPSIAKGSCGLLLQLASFMAYAFILKTIIVVLEGAGLWPEIPGLSLVISVVGFAIGVLLSTRLGTVQARMYDFEVGIGNLAATVRIIRGSVPDTELLRRFTRSLERYSQGECEQDEPQRALERVAAAGPGSVGPPIWINFNQTAQFAIERLGVAGTSEYTRVLRNVIVIYIVSVLLVIPGLTGLLSAVLVVYVLGGMLMLILNMEKPYSVASDSLINADLAPLFRLNRSEGDSGATEAEAKKEPNAADEVVPAAYKPA